MGTTLRALLDLPEAVRKGDFVMSLADGVENPGRTVADYALTANLVQTFDRALGLVDAGLKGGRSQASYLHGSFGSGKSHFMAMLDLMLSGHEAPWTRPELHPLRKKFDWVAERKFLQLPLHMIGAQSIEEKVFGAYVRRVQERHPDAPIPALYADQSLFDNAEQIRSAMGDDAFFGKLNEVVAAGASKWGKRAAAWDGARFQAAAASADPKEREALFSALVKRLFPAFATQTNQFLDLDQGLGILSRHAAGLGYDAVVLYLDELILWLAGKVSDIGFVQDEAQKLAKLKEAQDEKRSIPIISYVARQRDLGELVGDQVAGETLTTLRDALNWSSGRFETIRLEDRNLPAVVEHRVVKKKDAAAKLAIEDQIPGVRRRVGNAWGTLLGAHGTEADFKQVYPFSPALIDALVAVSDCLQRERTAIRVLMELLVEHLQGLKLGDVVPVGDIYDVLAGGEDAFDALMQDRFNRAKGLYKDQFLPIIQGTHGTTTAKECQRLRAEHPVRLGCSGCDQTACQNDNRLAKTLLLAAFVPNAAPFRDFTVSKLVHLNPGAVRVPPGGNPVQSAVGKVRQWATQVGQLRVGEQADPEVSVRLEGVDLGPIIESAQEADTPGNRRRIVQAMLFRALELKTEGTTTVPKTLTFRGTKRPGLVRFGNVRELPDQAFGCPKDAEWAVIIDYPFDVPGFGPADDLKRVDAVRDTLGGKDNPTLVWLPHFFTETIERELGKLAIIEHILFGDNVRKYLGHLRTEDQSRARLDLESLKSQKQAQIRRTLEECYALTAKSAERVDATRSVEESVVSLQPGLAMRPVVAASFKDALQQLFERLMEHRHPHHPRFGSDVTPGKLEKVRGFFDKLLDASDEKLPVEKSDVSVLRDFAEPLGLLKLHELTAHLTAADLRRVEQERLKGGTEIPTVEQVRAYVDPTGSHGYPQEVSDLLVEAYALRFGRSLERGGKPYKLEKLGKLDPDVELVLPNLPGDEAWHEAIAKAGHFFGVAQPRRNLSARNVTELAEKLAEAAARHAASRRLEAALDKRLSEWASSEEDVPRRVTAASSAELLERLAAPTPTERVENLASYAPKTSLDAVKKSLGADQKTLAALNDDPQWLNFATVRKYQKDPARANRAADILEDLKKALVSDQLNVDLPAKLQDLTKRAAGLIQEDTVHFDPAPPKPGERVQQRSFFGGPAEVLAELETWARAQLAPLGGDASAVELSVTLVTKEPER